MSISNLPSYWENGHGREPTEPSEGYLRVLAVQQEWCPNPVESLAPDFLTSSLSKNARNMSFQRPHPTGSAERHGNRTNAVEPHMPQDPTSTSGSQRASALADDEHSVRKSEEEMRKEPDWRMWFVWRVVKWLLREVECYDCPRRPEWWLRIIEGDDDDDDLWLWVDGDEEWLGVQRWMWEVPGQIDQLNAQSALRRRIARKRCPPLTGRNEKVRNATPEQRVYAIAWLIASSKGVAELFASHGRTPPTLRTSHIVCTFNEAIFDCDRDAFPSRTNDWESALLRSKEDGCICSPADCRGMRKWFDMMVWLEDRTPTLVVGEKPCVRCRSLLKSRYEEIAAKRTVTSHVSLLDALCNYCSDVHDMYFSRRLSLETKLLADGMLEPVLKEYELDMRYLPLVNKYPARLRPYVTKLLCGGLGSTQKSLPTVELPDSIFDGVHDPWVVLGTIALAVRDDNCADKDLHDDDWHAFFPSFLRRCFECFDLPALPRLSSTSIRLCREITQEYAEQRRFRGFQNSRDDCDWVDSGQDHRQLPLCSAVMAAVATFLRIRDVKLYVCYRCQDTRMESFSDTSSAVGFGVANSGEHEGLGPPSAYIREGNTLEGSHSSSLQKSLAVGMQEPVGMEAFTTYLRDPTLSKDEVQLRMVARFLKLRQYLGSCGLDASDCFHRSDGGGLEHVPDHGISRSKLSKSDKVEQIKDKLLEMLREHDLPYKRLPWYTLDKDLKKHGCALVNWPAGVLRKRGNRGIHDLSAVEVNSLYEAIMSSDESRRLRICRCPSTLTVVPVQHTSAAESGSKRPIEEIESHRHPSKRIRFKDMTSKVSRQHLSDLQADGATGSLVF